MAGRGFSRQALVSCLVAILLLPVSARAAGKPDLWLYYATNLQVNANVDALQRVWTRAAAAGFTHVLLADSKFARLGDLGGMQRVYFANIARTRRIAADLNLQIVPALFNIGYSNDLLYHDPDLAEGLPVKDAHFCRSRRPRRNRGRPTGAIGAAKLER